MFNLKAHRAAIFYLKRKRNSDLTTNQLDDIEIDYCHTCHIRIIEDRFHTIIPGTYQKHLKSMLHVANMFELTVKDIKSHVRGAQIALKFNEKLSINTP